MHIDDIAKKLYTTLDRNGDLWHLLDPAAKNRYTSAARIVIQEAEKCSEEVLDRGLGILSRTPLNTENFDRKELRIWLNDTFKHMLRSINGGY